MGDRHKAWTAVLSGLLCLAVPALAAPRPSIGSESGATAAHPDGLADGAGVWLNMWHYPTDANSYCLKLNNTGVRNIFIQTSRSNTEAIANPQKLSELIDTAHRYKIRVIGWSFAELARPDIDAQKLIDAARFKSGHGERLDAVAANLEKDLSAPKVESYSQILRHQLGESYPLIAVVYSPLNHAPQVATIPWKLLGQYYNVIAPMNYWNSKYATIEPYDYTLSTVRRVRELAGRPDLEVHVIGDGMGTHADTINKFLAACKASAATSASLYPNQQMTDEQFECLSHYSDYFPVNSRFRLEAFREICRRGQLKLSEKVDPSDAIQRGDFYRLIVLQIFRSATNGSASKLALHSRSAKANVNEIALLAQKLDAADFSPIDSLKVLAQVGVVKLPQEQTNLSLEDYLSTPLSTREALETVATALEARDKLRKAIAEANLSPQNRIIKNLSNRAGHFFVPPAYAAESRRGDLSSGRTLNYLDASQIVVQASGGLK
jgi:hypothetical protein